MPRIEMMTMSMRAQEVLAYWGLTPARALNPKPHAPDPVALPGVEVFSTPIPSL